MSKRKLGFAVMNPELQKEIASKGGKSAHAAGTAHEFDSEEGRIAGTKGGITTSRKPGHMAEIGRKGGQAKKQRNVSLETERE